ncbi:AAA family ATPase [Kitasatospora sp. NPDC004272]
MTPRGTGRRILPYSLLVGQEDLCAALEIAHVDPAVGGVLATGQRGTAKTTTVRAFSLMVAGELPVTLPIGATDDRVIGGWRIEKLMQGAAEPEDGLLVEAADSGSRILYVDEINLLDDHLVNIILDVASTGLLGIQREGRAEHREQVDFTLVGTMNPDEGGLRPQLLDRFGLVADAAPEEDPERRRRIIETVLRFEAERDDPASAFITDALARDQARKTVLDEARRRLGTVAYGERTLHDCARIAAAFRLVGHRGDLVLGRAARALAAIENAPAVTADHLRRVARPALVHRRATGESGTLPAWGPEHDRQVDELLSAPAGREQ